ncbi:STAS domain-containing protein, partial [bacterium]|nr:STAS domain-containing protein [bacterium]
MSEDNDVLVIELRQDNLDASNVREFKDAVQTLIQEHTRVVLDMSGVKFVDSSGLGALISCLRQLNGRHGDFKLCAMSKTVRALFELMRMHRVFN